MPTGKPNYQSYLKYSGLAMQIFAFFALAAWLGRWLDAYFLLSKPLLTILTVSVAFAMMVIWLNYSLKRP
jgi:hypothetical protein